MSFNNDGRLYLVADGEFMKGRRMMNDEKFEKELNERMEFLKMASGYSFFEKERMFKSWPFAL